MVCPRQDSTLRHLLYQGALQKWISMCRDPLRGEADLPNAQWAKLEPLHPVGKRPGRPPVHSKRQLMDGIRRHTRVGAPWRDVPERYGP